MGHIGRVGQKGQVGKVDHMGHMGPMGHMGQVGHMGQACFGTYASMYDPSYLLKNTTGYSSHTPVTKVCRI